mgnify:CR=1 FL=1
MSDSELTYWIAFTTVLRNRLPIQREIWNHFESIEKAWNSLREEGMQEALDKAQKEVEFIHKHGIEVITLQDEHYPFRLRECADAPLVLYVKGKINLNEGKFLSIVGTRGASERGKDLTRKLVIDLSRKVDKLTIVSGLAYGIDVAAHKAALEAGLPTIIVPGHGLDRIYPLPNRQVAVEALKNGGLVTEYPSETEPEGFRFVERDRIIAALSDATVVVESKARGGSLITANDAFEYNRSVFAFPGRPDDVNSQGCNQLIRDQKAALIENADDLINAMMWDKKPTEVQLEIAELEEGMDPLAIALLQQMREKEEDVHINQLAMEAEGAYQDIVAQLTYLEMLGYIRAVPGGFYHVIK